MALGIIVSFVLVALIVILAILALVSIRKKTNKKTIFLASLIAIALLALVLVPSSFRTVETGEVAVVKHLGLAKEVKTPGTYFSFWLTNTYEFYDTKVQNVDISTAAYSSDAQTMNIQMTLQYQVMNDKVLNVANQYGSLETLQNRIQSIAIEKTKSILSSYKAMDIIADRASMSPAVETAIINAVGEEYFVNIVAVVLTNIDFSDAFEQAVEDKMIAEQAKLKAEYENETIIAQAAAEAEAKLKEAQAEIEIAKAKAEALKIAAEAEADANGILDDSLTEKILQQIYLEKWNGELPDVMTGNDNTSIMIPFEEKE
ncbi:MAG: prohibitin family protein [Clostridia bacterium]|nr:prohibitin family protein [Clostridia bacterium]